MDEVGVTFGFGNGRVMFVDCKGTTIECCPDSMECILKLLLWSERLCCLVKDFVPINEFEYCVIRFLVPCCAVFVVIFRDEELFPNGGRVAVVIVGLAV